MPPNVEPGRPVCANSGHSPAAAAIDIASREAWAIDRRVRYALLLEPYGCLSPALTDYIATWTAKRSGALTFGRLRAQIGVWLSRAWGFWAARPLGLHRSMRHCSGVAIRRGTRPSRPHWGRPRRRLSTRDMSMANSLGWRWGRLAGLCLWRRRAAFAEAPAGDAFRRARSRHDRSDRRSRVAAASFGARDAHRLGLRVLRDTEVRVGDVRCASGSTRPGACRIRA